MPTLNVAKQYDATLKAQYTSGLVTLSIVYESGREFPWSGMSLNKAKWDRLVAWIELQRKEEALQKK